MGIAATAVILFLALAVAVNGLSINSSRVFHSKLSMGSDESYDVAEFVVDFDDDLYIKNNSMSAAIDITTITQAAGSGDKSMPLLFSLVNGVYGLRCSNGSTLEMTGFSNSRKVVSYIGTFQKLQEDGPPALLLTSTPSDEPLADIMKVLGGLSLPSNIPRRKFSFLLLLGGSEKNMYMENVVGGYKALLQCNPSIVFPGTDGPSRLVDKNGVPFQGSTNPVPQASDLCNYQDALTFVNQLDFFINTTSTVSSYEDFRRVDKMMASFTSRRAFVSCQRYLYSFLSLVNTSFTVSGSRECWANQNDPTFATNPCCNQTLAFMPDKCCVAGPDIKVPYTAVDSVLSSKVVAQCSNPGLLTPLLRAFVDAVTDNDPSKTADAQSNDDTFRGYREGVQKCYSDARWGSSCKTDSDCPWPPNTCQADASGSNGRCDVDVVNPFPAFAACLLTRLDQVVVREALDLWNISSKVAAVFDNSTTGGTDFIKPFIAPVADFLKYGNYSVDDCVSDRDTPFARRFDCTTSGNGGCVLKVTPANQTGCLSVKQCNAYTPGSFYDPNAAVTEASCASKKPDSFCAQCTGINCQDVTRLPVCRLNGPKWAIVTSAACAEAGGYWVKNNDNAGLPYYCAAFNTNTTIPTANMCLNDTRVCVPTRWSNNQKQCGQSRCYIPEITTLSDCMALFTTTYGQNPPFNRSYNTMYNVPNWDWSQGQQPSTGGICEITPQTCPGGMCWGISNSECSTTVATTFQKPTQFWAGRDFIEGAFYTEAQCALGRCNRHQLSFQMATKAECESYSACSSQCMNLCQSNNRYAMGTGQSRATLCKAPANIDQKNCTAMGGDYFNNMFCAVSHNGTQAGCSALGAGYTFYSCRSAETKSACTAMQQSTENQYLQCNWNPYTQCDTKADCDNSGFCSDSMLEWVGRLSKNIRTGGSSSVINWDDPASQIGEVCVIPSYGFQTPCPNFYSGLWPDNTVKKPMMTEFGCAVYTPDQATCTARKGLYLMKSFNQTGCLAPKACKIKDTWGNSMFHLSKSQSQCTSCGGSWESLFKWVPGKWNAGSMQPLTWKTKRELVPVNSWTRTIDQLTFPNAIDTVIGRILGRKMLNDFRKKVSIASSLIKTLACDCTSDSTRRNCFDQSGTLSQTVAEAKPTPGVAFTFGLRSNFVFPNNTFANRTSSPTLTLYQSPAGSIASANLNTRSRRTPAPPPPPGNNVSSSFLVESSSSSSSSSSNDMHVSMNDVERVLLERTSAVRAHHFSLMVVGNSATYAIVTNSYGGIIGQIIGDGLTLQSTATISSGYQLCLNKATYIDQDTATFPILDFARGSPSAPTSPLGVTVQFINNQYCATVSTDGFFIPILRVADYLGTSTATDVPSAPSNLKVSIAPGAPTSVSVSWIAPTASSLNPIASYTITASTDVGFATNVKSYSISAPATSTVLSGFSLGSTVFVKMTATTGAGVTSVSSTIGSVSISGVAPESAAVQTSLKFKKDLSALSAADSASFLAAVQADLATSLGISLSRVEKLSVSGTNVIAFTIASAVSGSTEIDPATALAKLNAQISSPLSPLRTSSTIGAWLDSSTSATGSFTCSDGTTVTDLSKCPTIGVKVGAASVNAHVSAASVIVLIALVISVLF